MNRDNLISSANKTAQRIITVSNLWYETGEQQYGEAYNELLQDYAEKCSPLVRVDFRYLVIFRKEVLAEANKIADMLNIVMAMDSEEPELIVLVRQLLARFARLLDQYSLLCEVS